MLSLPVESVVWRQVSGTAATESHSRARSAATPGVFVFDTLPRLRLVGGLSVKEALTLGLDFPILHSVSVATC